jgi:hypothetical protein
VIWHERSLQARIEWRFKVGEFFLDILSFQFIERPFVPLDTYQPYTNFEHGKVYSYHTLDRTLLASRTFQQIMRSLEHRSSNNPIMRGQLYFLD